MNKTHSRIELIRIEGLIMLRAMIGFILSATVTAAGAGQTLHVYGPGGPMAPIKECAELYQQKTGVKIEVMAGPEQSWIDAAQTNADVIFGGADYMLTKFELDHKGFLLPGSRVELFDRAVGILVRPGNPKSIRGMTDLAKPGMRLLDVNGAGQTGLWEDLAGRKGLISAVSSNVIASVANSAQGIEQWNTRPELDAWITFESWAKRLPGKVELVRLPEGERLYRGTPAAVASRSTSQDQARSFLVFLQSPSAHAVFVKWGWR